MYKLIIDMMGSDKGPQNIADAIIKFLSNHDDVSFLCVGDSSKYKNLRDNNKISLVETTNVIKMDDDPMSAIKNKESSMMKAFSLYKETEADAIVSCGGTGAYLTGATLLLGRIKGVKRPCLVAPFPTKIKNKSVVILDVGANNSNSSDDLIQFSLMGEIYSKLIFNIESPKIGLLSNGSEDHKGTNIIKEANQRLRTSDNFVGNIEARYCLDGNVDVVVTDGFSGNIFLKATEGTFKIINNMLKKGFKKNIITKIGYLFSRSVIYNLKSTFNYKSTGGAMLLGVKGNVVKAHGNTDFEAMLGAINVAYKFAKNDMWHKIEEEIINEPK